MPHQIRTVNFLPPRPLRGALDSPRAGKGVRVALMTRAHRPAIAPVVRSPQRPTAPDRLAQDSQAPLSEVVVLPAARGCDDQPAVSTIRGGAPTRIPTGDPCRRPGRRLPEEIAVPASDQQSHSTQPTTHEGVP